MPRRVALVAISTAQLAAGIAGQLVALDDRRSFDFALIGWHGRPDRVARDSWLLGTGLSAPVVMLGVQAVATGRLAARPSRSATSILEVLGGAMTCGYLVEGQFPRLLSPGGWDRRATPVVAVGFALPATTGLMGLGDCLRRN